MTGTPMPWVKLYTEMLDDPKIGRMEPALRWRFVEMILLAGECDADGLLITGDEPMSIEDMAWRLRSDAKAILDDLKKMQKIGLMDFDDDCWLVCKFRDRQGRPQSEKREQWRDRQKKHRDVTQVSRMTNAPREEKRREDKIRKDSPAPVGAEPPNNGKKPPEKTAFILAMEQLERDFALSRGCDPPDWTRPKEANKRWRTPLAQLYHACGDDTGITTKLIRDTVDRMRKDKLTFDAPDQILKVALAERADQRLDGRGPTTPMTIAEELALARRKAGLE